MYQWQVTKEEQGLSLIQFVRRQLKGMSQKMIKDWIHRNGCLVNDRVERFSSFKVNVGDRIVIRPIESQPLTVQTVFEDAHIKVIDKPPGCTTESMVTGDFLLVHRLDRDTSGLLLMAKSESIQGAFEALFRRREVAKVYSAIVDGSPKENKGVINSKLQVKGRFSGQKIWSSQETGRLAITEWEIEQRFKDAAWINCYPLTGRTHQLRVHLMEMGHPILGDYQYGRTFIHPYRPLRHMLHAEEMAFTHPVTGDEMAFKTPLPEDFAGVIKLLKTQ